VMVEDYTIPTPRGGRARVRIYQTNAFALPVVLCTEPEDNEGMSITNAAEQIAAEVLSNHPEIFAPFSIASDSGIGYDKPFVWVEHYQDGARGTPEDPATFDLVAFEHYEPREVLRAGEWAKEIGEPRWKSLDRATVETLIGEPLDEG
jgi:hypothetical protein